MSWSWYLYTTLAPPEVVRVDAAYQAAIEAYLEEHDVDDVLAETGAAGPPPPRPDEVSAYRARFGETVDPALLARLANCRTTIAFDDVRSDVTDSPLQVSALQFLLERLAPCVFDRGEFSLELGETLLDKLARVENRGQLGATRREPRTAKPAKRRPAKPGELRAIAILEQLSRLAADPDLRLDLQRAVAGLSGPAQRYVELLVSEGACSDADAARSLALDADALQHVIDEIAAALAEL